MELGERTAIEIKDRELEASIPEEEVLVLRMDVNEVFAQSLQELK